jgi:hypothetical protein
MVKIKLQQLHAKPGSSVANKLWLSVPSACASIAEHNEMPQNQQSKPTHQYSVLSVSLCVTVI